MLILLLISWGFFWWEYINWVYTVWKNMFKWVRHVPFPHQVISDKTGISEKAKQAGTMIQQI